MKKTKDVSWEKEHCTPEWCDYLFGGANSVSEEFRIILAQSLSRLPKEIVDWTVANVNFISSSEEFYALAFPKKQLRSIPFKGFVFLSEDLKKASKEKQITTIAHEIAHMRLNHKSFLWSNITEEENEKQEIEADEQAKRWLNIGHAEKTKKK